MAQNPLKFMSAIMLRKIPARRAWILLRTQEAGEICNSDVTRELRVNAAMVSNDIKKLLEKRWIAPCPRKKGRNDMRLQHYRLTPQGTEVILAITGSK